MNVHCMNFIPTMFLSINPVGLKRLIKCSVFKSTIPKHPVKHLINSPMPKHSLSKLTTLSLLAILSLSALMSPALKAASLDSEPGVRDLNINAKENAKVIGQQNASIIHNHYGPSLSSDKMAQRLAAVEQEMQRQCEKEEAQLKTSTPSSSAIISSSSAIISHSVSIPRPLAQPIPAIARGYEAIYQRFLKGVLIYRPDPNSNVGLNFPIAALLNPLDGVFDLSRCGDASQYLSIATGYKKGKNPMNVNKIEIFITPRFLIAQELNTTAGHFKGLMSSCFSAPDWPETSPVGLFWTYGGWDNLEWMDRVIARDFEVMRPLIHETIAGHSFPTHPRDKPQTWEWDGGDHFNPFRCLLGLLLCRPPVVVIPEHFYETEDTRQRKREWLSFFAQRFHISF